MEPKMRLNILGCVPTLLDVLIELANESNGTNSFRILKNIPVEMQEHFNSNENWNVQIIEEGLSFENNPLECYAFSVVGPPSKSIVFQEFEKSLRYKRNQFINLIHPTSYVSPSVTLEYGLQLEPLSTISSCTSLGFGVNIKRNSSIGHHCRIEDFATINPGVTMSGGVEVGALSMIGSGAVIKNNLRIGRNTVIGAGSVVVKDIPANSIAYGNPCVVHRVNDVVDRISK